LEDVEKYNCVHGVILKYMFEGVFQSGKWALPKLKFFVS